MIIWKSLVDEYLQCVREPTNKVVKNAVAIFLTNSNYAEEWLVMCDRNLHDCIHVSISAPLRFGYLCNHELPQPWRSIQT